MKALHVTLILSAIAVMQVFFGGGDGTRLIYALPGYLLLGLSGVLTLFSFWKAPANLDRACLLATLFLALYIFARIALSPSAWLARADFYSVLAALLVYFLTALFVSSNGARCAIAAGLIVLGLTQSGIGIFQFAREASFNPILTETRAEIGVRASGFFISPNHLAGFLETALLFATSFLFWGGFRVRGKILVGYVALVCLAGLVLTGSRGGYISAGIGFAFFATMSVWTLRARLEPGLVPRLIGTIVAIALIGGGLTIVAQRSFAIQSRASTVYDPSNVRFHLWEAAWKQFQLAPTFGTGSRTYVQYGRTFRAPQMQMDPVFAHNDWLQTLAEYGIAGVILVVGFVVAHLRQGWRRWLRMVARFSPGVTSPADSRALALQIGTLSAISACLVHAIMDFNLHIPANLLVTAFLFGMLATRRPRNHGERATWPGRALHMIPAGLGLWMLYAGVPQAPGELFLERARGKFATGKITAALEDAGQAIARGVQNPELYFQLGEVQRIMSHSRRSDEARKWAIEDAHDAYAEALAIFPQDVGIVLQDAWALSRLGRFEEAEALLVRAKTLDPNSPKVWTYSALHWKLRGRPVEALEDYRRVQAMNEGWIPHFLKDLHENLDRQELENAAQAASPAKSD